MLKNVQENANLKENEKENTYIVFSEVMRVFGCGTFREVKELEYECRVEVGNSVKSALELYTR